MLIKAIQRFIEKWLWFLFIKQRTLSDPCAESSIRSFYPTGFVLLFYYSSSYFSMDVLQ